MEKEITYKNDKGTSITAFLASPQNISGKLPAILLIHEIFGLDEHIRNVARRLSCEGYFVMAPNLMYDDLEKITSADAMVRMMPLLRTLPREAYSDAEKVKEVAVQLSEQDRPAFETLIAVVGGIYAPRFINDLKYAYHYLANDENVNVQKVASLGFCFGGGMAGLLAGNVPEMNAHVIFYGQRPPAAKIQHITAPILGIYGSLDTGITSTIPTLAEEMKNAGKNFQYVIYEGAAHAFFNETRKQVYNPEAAAKAWEVVKSFLKKNL